MDLRNILVEPQHEPRGTTRFKSKPSLSVRSKSEKHLHPAPMTTTNNQPCEIYSYTGDISKLVLVLVGLPARGKTFISRKISRYLSWLGIRIKSFNIGNYRRLGAKETVGKASADFFNPQNKEAAEQREKFAHMAMEDLLSFLQKGGQIAVLDGTNTTRERRGHIKSFFDKLNINCKLVFIESVCTDEKIIESNIMAVKLSSPDYAHVPPHEAILDFKKRIQHYEKIYEAVDEQDGSYIKMVNAGKHVIGHDVNGYLTARIMYYLMHLNLLKKPIFLTRHGESEYNTEGKIGGDSPLSLAGKRYSKALADFITLQPEWEQGMKIWCSTLKRTLETCEAFGNVNILKWRALCEIDAGIFDGYTYEKIEKERPEEYLARKIDKLNYRYPQGESYKDVIQRLEPVIFELERSTKPILIVSHRAVIRCLYAYFMDMPLDQIPRLEVDLHTVYKLTPRDYGTDVDQFTFGLVASKPHENSNK